jgi:uncharacterized cupin superfamily protein
MPRINLDALEPTNRTGYPPPFNEPVQGRWQRRVAEAAGLSKLGARHVVLDPGAWSSQRHWHEGEDEFLVMLEGEAVLIEDDGETALEPGDCAAFPKGVANGHQLVNRTGENCVFIVFGKAALSDCHYPDVDLHLDAASGRFTRKDGSPY